MMTNPMSFFFMITDFLDKGNTVHHIFTVSSKAFGTVPYENYWRSQKRLSTKQIIRWVRNLTELANANMGTYYWVILREEASDLRKFTRVPQGSILGLACEGHLSISRDGSHEHKSYELPTQAETTSCIQTLWKKIKTTKRSWWPTWPLYLRTSSRLSPKPRSITCPSTSHWLIPQGRRGMMLWCRCWLLEYLEHRIWETRPPCEPAEYPATTQKWWGASWYPIPSDGQEMSVLSMSWAISNLKISGWDHTLEAKLEIPSHIP